MKSRTVLLFIMTLCIGFLMITVNHASARTDELVHILELSASGYERAHTLAFSPNGNHLAVGGTSGIYLFDYQDLSETDFIQTGSWARSITFLPKTNTLAAGLFDNTIKFWNIPDTQPNKTLDDPKGWVRSISVSRDGTLIAAASDDDTIRVWQTVNDELTLVLNETKGVRAVALSSDGKLIAGALADNTIRVWNVSNSELRYTLKGHTDWPRCLAFSPDGQLLASGGFDKNIRLWNMSDGSLQQRLEGHNSSVLGVAFSPDGQMLASGSVDQTVRLWNVNDGVSLQILQGHTDFVYAVAFSADGKILASGGGDNTVRLWNLEYMDVNPVQPVPATPSDCRQCHHRRGQNEPARVIDLSCEACHFGGIGLSWCIAFPRSSLVAQSHIQHNAAYDISGVPINDHDIAVIIASPGNGESFYVMGNFMAPEVIGGRVFYKDQANITEVNVRLDIISSGQTTASLMTNPSESGNFLFNVAINPESPPSYSSRPATRQCIMCHDDSLAEAGIPPGIVHFLVTATTPDGQQASDERWTRVDASRSVTLPVQVLDDETREPLTGLLLEASTILYEWRDRYGSGASDSSGTAHLELEELSQSPTSYDISLQPQLLNGMLYVSPETVSVTLDPEAEALPVVTLTARALKGQIDGVLTGVDSSSSMQGMNIWAIQLPSGPVYQTSLTHRDTFAFQDIPIGQYLLTADAFALAEQNLHISTRSVDLFESPESSLEFSPVIAKPLSGSVTAEEEIFLPFAWLTEGDQGDVLAVNPISGNYLIPDLPTDVAFITASAPGYHSLLQGIPSSGTTLEFQLVARPETQFIPWGDGQVVLPPETSGTVSNLEFDLKYGWLWGQSDIIAGPLQIHLPNMDITITNGRFAIENPAEGTGWLHILDGEARLTDINSQAQVEVGSGEMIALMGGARPIPMESAVIMALHPTPDDLPVSEITEPTLSAKIQSWLAKAGIGVLQIITFITYILSLATLFVIIFRRLFLTKKSSPNEEKQ